ncbi:MAG: response regulator [Nitrospinae bacterium]|nr:response regulator [Nitrospinota bacterium]
MRIQFWGTRGSLAKPGPTTLRYGGNTSCVEVRTADGTLIILDCGTGAHGLGEALVAAGETPLRGHLLITHTHWDHIQGFPFFTPLFIPGHEWDIYAPAGPGRRLEDILAGQMEYAYFPITLQQLNATVRYHDLVEGAFDLGSVHVSARYLNHPALTLGYRLEAGGVAVVYATDHEPHAGAQLTPAQRESAAARDLGVHHEDRRHIEFLAGADLVIHDAQYTAAEYAKKVGWGHSSIEYAVDAALAARVKRLALFHHDPWRDDVALAQLVEAGRQRVATGGGSLEVLGAAEGQVLELAEQEGTSKPTGGLVEAAAREDPGGAGAAAKTVLIVDDERDIVGLLTMALRAEGFRLLTAHDGDTALQLARAQHPSLILLDWLLPGRDGLEVCRALRAEADPQLRHVPVVLLTGQTGAEDIAAGFAAGVTDYLMKPFKPTYVRSRVREWLLRARSDTPAAEERSR